MPLFGKSRRAAPQEEERVLPATEALNASEFSVKLSYGAKSSEVVQIKNGRGMPEKLKDMLTGYIKGESETIEPLPPELAQSSPYIAQVPGSIYWLQSHQQQSPVARHALVCFETTDAIDMVFETLVVGLLDGHLDTSGYPDYNALVGGVVSHWDENTGDLLVRGIVGWGGNGVRGDTERTAGKILAGLFNNIVADSQSLGTVSVQRPLPFVGSGGTVCAHCGYHSGHERAFYCPKCGMRMLRG